MIIKNTGQLDAYQQINAERTAKSEAAAKDMNTQNIVQPKMDTINLSNDAVLIQEAHTTAMNAPDVRTEKVEHLKTQVQSGAYSPNSMKIAEAFVSDMQNHKNLYI